MAEKNFSRNIMQICRHKFNFNLTFKSKNNISVDSINTPIN